MDQNYNKPRKSRSEIIVTVIAIVASIMCAILLTYSVFITILAKQIGSLKESYNISSEYTPSKELKDTIDMMLEIDKVYNGAYVNDIKYDDLKYNIINAMIQTYGDKWGAYLDAERAKSELDSTNSQLEGIGVMVRAEQGKDGAKDDLYVIDSFKESDSRAKGITTGCLITKVDGKTFSIFDTEADDYISYEDLIASVKGKAGTTVEITYEDTNGTEHTVEVTRKKITAESVKYKIINNDIGYIQIREFDKNTDEEFEEALKYMKSNNIEKVIYDLRDNRGGLLDSVVNMLDMLCGEGPILKVIDNEGYVKEKYMSDQNHYDFDTVILVNGNTASASELFTQALRDYKIGTVIGSKTVGKGTVCTMLQTSDNGIVMLSTSKYVTASDTCPEDDGIEPDIECELPDDKKDISYKLSLDEDDIVLRAIDELE